jgi:rhodanese-related sulfurtransferase
MLRYFYLTLPFLLLFHTGCTGQDNAETATSASVDLAVAAFAEKMDTPDVVILDVRTPGETARGMIIGAREIDYRAADFAERVAELDRDKTYLVYCQSGGRSSSAVSAMSEMGFKNVYNLLGGYGAWSAAHAEE